MIINGFDIAIIGAGRMGIRHAQGALASNSTLNLFLVDISEESLENAKNQLSSHPNFDKIEFLLLNDFRSKKVDVVIIASTASNRIEVCNTVKLSKPNYILIEKPLGQSISEVKSLIKSFIDYKGEVFVNLNTRMYPFIKQLKQDLLSFPQFVGPVNINFNGGSLGIGANGIHYLDLLFHLYGASDYKLEYAKIDKNVLPSGRGPSFGDFGGVAVIEFFKNESYLGRANISMTSMSTVFGGWDIIGSHGRILINELEGIRTDILRDEESKMPINRYAADYHKAVETKISSPNLDVLTNEWLDELAKGKQILPNLHQSLKVHELMFEWLNKSETHFEVFPIT